MFQIELANVNDGFIQNEKSCKMYIQFCSSVIKYLLLGKKFKEFFCWPKKKKMINEEFVVW